jgi:hypothetical protein
MPSPGGKKSKATTDMMTMN